MKNKKTFLDSFTEAELYMRGETTPIIASGETLIQHKVKELIDTLDIDDIESSVSKINKMQSTSAYGYSHRCTIPGQTEQAIEKST